MVDLSLRQNIKITIPYLYFLQIFQLFCQNIFPPKSLEKMEATTLTRRYNNIFFDTRECPIQNCFTGTSEEGIQKNIPHPSHDKAENVN